MAEAQEWGERSWEAGMVMKPIRKCRRKDARSLTLPTVAEGSFWLLLWWGRSTEVKQDVS